MAWISDKCRLLATVWVNSLTEHKCVLKSNIVQTNINIAFLGAHVAGFIGNKFMGKIDTIYGIGLILCDFV